MQTVRTIKELRELVAIWKAAGETVALVPTMGNLHDGHLSLVSLARQQASRVIVSVFVNPSQFGPNEDFDRYPRTLDDDAKMLMAASVDALFCPAVSEVYPCGLDNMVEVVVPGLSEELCGEFRPGHFTGVASVVARLLNMANPDVAVFGQKDYQQLVVLRCMVQGLHLPLKVLSGDTVRGGDGLALSSRNSLLSVAERTQATIIYKALRAARSAMQKGVRTVVDIEAEGFATIQAGGLVPEYFAVRAATNLARPDANKPPPQSQDWVILTAAKLGNVRLIDNVLVKAA